MKTALTIAGSDSSGGAGIQADLKTMTMNGVFAMSAVTALTAQNTTGVTGIMEVTPEFLKQQIDMVFTDIRPDAVKIGMVSSSALIETIAGCLKEYQADNIVVDPVMVATSGSALIETDAVNTLKKELFPLASVVTPNIPEAELLSQMTIRSAEDMEKAAEAISRAYGCGVLVKGGHAVNDANDVLYADGEITWFTGRRIDNPNTHGTGCTLSSAIAANLAKGCDLHESVRRAKAYISGALSAMLDLGKGRGPMNHAFDLKGEFADRMPVSERLLQDSADIWQEYNQHPFVRGIQDGTLSKDRFRFYMIQDYLYLEEYAKAFAVGVAKAKSIPVAMLFAKYIPVMTGELNVHEGYLARLNVTQEEIDSARRSLDNVSYTSYMLRVAYEEGEAEILAAILSCAYSYQVIAEKILQNNPKADQDPFYGDWVRGYSDAGYAEANVELIDALNRLTKDYNEEQIAHLSDIFRICSRYELAFWEMSDRMSL